MVGAEAYVRAKFRFDPSNRLAPTLQTGQDRTGQIDRQNNGLIAGLNTFIRGFRVLS